MKYQHLFSPLKVNDMILKNRIIAAPIGEEFSEKAGFSAEEKHLEEQPLLYVDIRLLNRAEAALPVEMNKVVFSNMK